MSDKIYDFHLSKLTGLLFNLNHLIDQGTYVQCPYDKMMELIKSEAVLEYLSNEMGLDVSWQFNSQDDEFKKWFDTALLTFSECMDPIRKMGVQYNGITLLLGYVIEMIQQDNHTWKPSSNIAGL